MSNYRDFVLADNPVSYWRLNERSGTTANDQMGLNTGTFSGGFSLGLGSALFDDFDYGVSFDGISGQLNVPHSGSLVFTTACTIEAWVMLLATPIEDGACIVAKENGPTWALIVAGYAGLFHVKFQVGAAVTSQVSDWSRSIQLSTWAHMVGVYTGSLVRLYIDGVEQGVAAAFSDPLNNAGQPVIMGYSTISDTFQNMRLDEVAVYNYALSQSRIMAHFLAGKAGSIGADPDPTHFPSSRGRG